MDALLIETEPYGEREIVDPSDEYWTGEVVATLELVRSWDHGARRTADELAQSVAAETMFYVLRPVLLAAGCRVDYGGADPYAVVDELAPIPHDGGWCEDLDASEILSELFDEAAGWAADVGMILETSGDCGMTWLYLTHDVDPTAV